MKKSKAEPAEKYLVLIGFNYGHDNKRHEPGDVVTLPLAVAETLLGLEQPAITRDHEQKERA
jgi:hypothetical protein